MRPSSFLVCLAVQVGFCFTLLSLVRVTANAADSTTRAIDTPPAPKTHVLFMGADFSVEKNRKFYPVEDVTPSAIVIKPSDKAVQVPLTQNAHLLITESVKISSADVAINRLKFERAYSLGADPFEQLARSATMTASNGPAADIAQGELTRANQSAGTTGMQVANAANPAEAQAAAADHAMAMGNLTEAAAGLNNTVNAPGSQALDMTGQSGKAGSEMFDAIRIGFEVTPNTDLAQPYVGVIARIRERDSKSGQVRKWAYVKALESMAAGVTRKVVVYRDGFPPGYVLEDCELHFYRGREELATNLSRRRVELTDDEALDYRIIEYVDANRERTLPATPTTTALPAEARERLTAPQLNGTYYVRVAKDGHVIATFHDAAGKQPVQIPAIESALKSIRFQPALAVGKPVESTVSLNLSQLLSSP